MDDFGRWDHYVTWECPASGVRASLRCLGLATAIAIQEQKRQLGFRKVQIVHRRFSRHKERASYVHDGSLHRLPSDRSG